MTWVPAHVEIPNNSITGGIVKMVFSGLTLPLLPSFPILVGNWFYLKQIIQFPIGEDENHSGLDNLLFSWFPGGFVSRSTEVPAI